MCNYHRRKDGGVGIVERLRLHGEVRVVDYFFSPDG